MSIFTYGPWHRWFAWHPVRTDWHGWRWLTTVYRRGWIADMPGDAHGWHYKPIKTREATEDTP